MYLKISRGHGFLGFVLQTGITHAMETGGGEEEKELMEELEESENLSNGSSHEDGSDKTNGSDKEEEDGECDTDHSPEEDCDEQENETETGDEDEEEEKEKEEDEGGDQRVATMENLGNYSEKLQKALIGDLDDDFPESVKVVRIFTSSTFTGKLFELESGDGSLELLTLLL